MHGFQTSDESEQVRMSKIQTWENHEFRRCSCTPAWYWLNSFGWRWLHVRQAIVVAEALRAFGNLADFGHQEKAGSVESWIFMIFMPQKCATGYASNAMAHEMVSKRKSISVSSSFGMLMRMSCDSVSIAHISSSYAVKFPWWDSGKMLQILQESHVQKVQRTHWQALCCLCQWHLGSKRKQTKVFPIIHGASGVNSLLGILGGVNFPCLRTRPETFYPFIDAHKNRGSAHLADNLMLVSESIVQTWATALQNVSLADVELQDGRWSNKLSSEKKPLIYII